MLIEQLFFAIRWQEYGDGVGNANLIWLDDGDNDENGDKSMVAVLMMNHMRMINNDDKSWYDYMNYDQIDDEKIEIGMMTKVRWWCWHSWLITIMIKLRKMMRTLGLGQKYGGGVDVVGSPIA